MKHLGIILFLNLVILIGYARRGEAKQKQQLCSINNIRACFDGVDTNKDGSLSLEESIKLLPLLEKRLSQVQQFQNILDSADLKSYFDSIDTNSDGLISFEEFKKAASSKLAKIMASRQNNRKRNVL